MVRQITVRPLMAPPTIAPMFRGSGLGGEDVEEGVVDGVKLDVGMGDGFKPVPVGGEVELPREMLGIEVEVDEIVDFVVVASVDFGN